MGTSAQTAAVYRCLRSVKVSAACRTAVAPFPPGHPQSRRQDHGFAKTTIDTPRQTVIICAKKRLRKVKIELWRRDALSEHSLRKKLSAAAAMGGAMVIALATPSSAQLTLEPSSSAQPSPALADSAVANKSHSAVAKKKKKPAPTPDPAPSVASNACSIHIVSDQQCSAGAEPAYAPVQHHQ